MFGYVFAIWVVRRFCLGQDAIEGTPLGLIKGGSFGGALIDGRSFTSLHAYRGCLEY